MEADGGNAAVTVPPAGASTGPCTLSVSSNCVPNRSFCSTAARTSAAASGGGVASPATLVMAKVTDAAVPSTKASTRYTPGVALTTNVAVAAPAPSVITRKKLPSAASAFRNVPVDPVAGATKRTG